MHSLPVRLASPRLVPFLVALLGAVGCGSGATTSTTGGGGAGGGTGTSGAGGHTSTATGPGSPSSTGVGTSSSTGSGLPGPPVPAGAPVYHLKAGAGTVIMPGFMAGFGITGDGVGNFVLVWTGNTKGSNPAIAFEGSVWTTGKFSSLSEGCSDGTCSLQADDKLGPIQDAMGGGQYIGFKASSMAELDGFEFSTDLEPVFFDLLYDGQEANGRVVYADADNGGSPANPQKMPFGITTQ